MFKMGESLIKVIHMKFGRNPIINDKLECPQMQTDSGKFGCPYWLSFIEQYRFSILCESLMEVIHV